MPNIDDLSDLFETMDKKSRHHVSHFGAESLAPESDALSELGSDTKSTTTMSSTSTSNTGKKTRRYERINTDGLSEIQVNEIRKSRKRQQNRVSSLKCRQRKKTYVSKLEDKTRGVVGENTRLCIENATLKTENDLLRRQLKYFEDLVVNMKNTPGRSVVLPSLEVGLAGLTSSGSTDSHEKQGAANPQATYNPQNTNSHLNLDEQVDDFFSPTHADDLRRDDVTAEEDFTALIQGGNRFAQRPVFMLGVVLCISLAVFGFSVDDEVEFGDHFSMKGGIKPLSVEESDSPFTSNGLKFWALVLSFILALVTMFTFGRDRGIKAGRTAALAAKKITKKNTTKKAKTE